MVNRDLMVQILARNFIPIIIFAFSGIHAHVAIVPAVLSKNGSKRPKPLSASFFPIFLMFFLIAIKFVTFWYAT